VDSSTDTSISQLAALQEIDSQQREKTALVEELEAAIAEAESRLAKQRDLTHSTQAERDLVEARRRELEAQLYVEEAKMKDRRMRLNRVRNEKELQALRREIELSKEANQQIEEEVLRLLESAETLNASAAEAERALAELEASATTKTAEQRARIEQVRRDVASEREVRTRMAAALDGDLLQKYEQIFKRRGGTAVVEVRNGTCLGCHMHLPPQFSNELQRSRDVRLCPNCHRILFWRPERLDPPDTPG
jgi:predicted  nucleic acid-binding Zn-ribbon protein